MLFYYAVHNTGFNIDYNLTNQQSVHYALLNTGFVFPLKHLHLLIHDYTPLHLHACLGS